MVMSALGWMLLAFSAAGVVALFLQLLAVDRRPAVPLLPAGSCPGISVLKPLCGVDDTLEDNLACFAALPYAGEVEVLLGVRSTEDAAFPVALDFVRRHPGRFRLFVQRGEPGYNPKVNQLITLSAAARYELLVVSDSNMRVPERYFFDIAGRFSAPDVGCVSHPIAGVGEQTLGAYLDNLELAAIVGAGVVAAKRFAGKDLVIGKSMALRRSDLERLGGFESVKDVLAEDHVLGNRVTAELKKRVVISDLPVFNVSVKRSVGDFFKRYLRWSVVQRTAVPLHVYVSQLLLNPIPLAGLGLLLAPSPEALCAAVAVAASRCLVDAATLGALRGGFPWLAMPVSFIKDAILVLCWCHGLFARTVNWRGNRLRVTEGSRLVPLAVEDAPLPVDAEIPFPAPRY